MPVFILFCHFQFATRWTFRYQRASEFCFDTYCLNRLLLKAVLSRIFSSSKLGSTVHLLVWESSCFMHSKQKTASRPHPSHIIAYKPVLIGLAVACCRSFVWSCLVVHCRCHLLFQGRALRGFPVDICSPRRSCNSCSHLYEPHIQGGAQRHDRWTGRRTSFGGGIPAISVFPHILVGLQDTA